MNDREHAEEILAAATRDLRALRGMVESTQFSEEIFGFHAQQACEKALKAWLAFRSLRYPKTHDLKKLIDLLAENDENTAGMDQLVDLNAYAVQYRYESLYEDEEPIDRAALIDLTSALIDRVSGLIRPPAASGEPEDGS